MNSSSIRIRDWNMIRLLTVSFLIVLLMTVLVPSRFFSVMNFQSMSFQFPEFGLFSIAMALSMFTGGSDLSIISTGNLAAIVSGTLIKSMLDANPAMSPSIAIFMSFIAAVLVGFACGAFNGFLISRFGIPPILTTLGTMQLFSGLGIVITKGSALYGFPELLNRIGNGFLFNFIPIPLVIFALIAAIFAFLIQKTSFGVKLFCLGSNEKAAKFAGLRISRLIIQSYIMSGILSAVAGIVILARTNSASADYGDAYLLQSMLVAIMGGVDPRGGHGKITGIIIAIITIQLLSSGLNMLNVNIYFKQLAYGALLLVMVILNRKSNTR